MRWLIGVLTALALSGCGVSKDVHRRALNNLDACQGKLGATSAKRDLAESRAQELDGELRLLRGDQKSLSAANREAAGRITKLGKEAAATADELEALRKHRAAAQKRSAEYQKLQDMVRRLTDAGKLKVNFRKGLMVIELPSGVLFASGQARLSRSGQGALSEILAAIKTLRSQRLMVTGHTDAVPIRGRRFKNNWHLSTARAVSVVDFMVGAGFPPSNLSAAGLAAYDPVATNETEEGRAKNRRIEIVLLPDLSELPKMITDPS